MSPSDSPCVASQHEEKSVGAARKRFVLRRRTALAGIVAVVTAGAALAVIPLASAADVVSYTATQTIPVPPSSAYAGSGGGDGWAVAVGSGKVYNVFHHASTLTVACHLQSDASECGSPATVTDTAGAGFATSGQPGLWLDQASGKLYVYATRTTDETGGVVCVDTATLSFCGFTALTAPVDSPLSNGISAISDPAAAGGKWWAFNYVADASGGARNKLLCFDLTAGTACPSQPYAVGFGGGAVTTTSYPPPAVTAIGTRVLVPAAIDGTDQLACFDATRSATCSGAWPITLGGSYVSQNGAAFPLLDATGGSTGFCLPTGTDPCYDLSGASVVTPAGLPAAVGETSGWNGGAVTVGPRVFVPDGIRNAVDCFDYATGAGCPGFPKAMADLNLLYTVNADPQRPTCIWVNADGGASQIQNFDAYTGGACGAGPVRVLASSMVVPTALCRPATYTSLQVTQPARTTYDTGTVEFQDGDAAPIPGLGDGSLDATGMVSLVGRNLSTATGLPQFLITLTNPNAPVGQVVVKLSWTGTNDPSCVKPGTTVGGGSMPPSSGPCANVVVIAATGSGQHYKSDHDLSVSPQLATLVTAMKSTAGGKTLVPRVLNYPATSVDALFAGLNTIKARNRADYLIQARNRLAANIDSYLAGEKQGVAALWGQYTAVRFGCPAPTKIVVVGYSQGAMVVHEFLNQLAATRDTAGKKAVIGAVLLADPERMKRSAVLEMSDAPYSSYGVCDVLSLVVHCAGTDSLADVAPPFRDSAVSVCSSDDPVCDTSDVVRRFADVWWYRPGRDSLVNLTKVVHESYRYDRSTSTAGKLIGRRIARG
ncbi:cutinase family protein [Asanoa sp. NPDC049573]|uniref:cutinase family protein n=1 Tax=Asanoa sp. NPDC049573 TaxID=3155396 RepID=UPI003424229A